MLNLPRFAQIVDCQMHLHHVYIQVLDFKRFGMPTLMASLQNLIRSLNEPSMCSRCGIYSLLTPSTTCESALDLRE
jgi:hypothetical protein